MGLMLLDTLKTKKFVVFNLMITFFVVLTNILTGYVRPSGEEVIITNFLSSGVAYDRLIVNGWTVLEDKNGKHDVSEKFNRLIKPLFSSNHYTTAKYTAKNSTTITAKGLIKPKVAATITLIKHNISKETPLGETYLVLSLESKDPDVPSSFLKAAMKSVLGSKCHPSMVISGYINRNVSPRQRDILIKSVFRTLGVQNMETLAAGPLVSVTGYTPSVRNVLTVSEKSVNINMALRYSTIDNKTMVYVGSPVITSEY